jgi:hypothetical protein
MCTYMYTKIGQMVYTAYNFISVENNDRVIRSQSNIMCFQDLKQDPGGQEI